MSGPERHPQTRSDGRVALLVDGEAVVAPARQSIAAVLLATGRTAFRHSPTGDPRGIYCGIGACYECRVHVEGRGVVLSCVTPVEPGMQITTGQP
jgi:predicted molibdopterin-dependent oxidoreductase YjgC